VVKLEVVRTESGTRRLLIPKLLWEEFFGNEERTPVEVRFPREGMMIVEKINGKDNEKPVLEGDKDE